MRQLLTAAVLLAPTIALAGRHAEPPIPDPTGEPAGFLTKFLELLRQFVEGLIGSGSV